MPSSNECLLSPVTKYRLGIAVAIEVSDHLKAVLQNEMHCSLNTNPPIGACGSRLVTPLPVHVVVELSSSSIWDLLVVDYKLSYWQSQMWHLSCFLCRCYIIFRCLPHKKVCIADWIWRASSAGANSFVNVLCEMWAGCFLRPIRWTQVNQWRISQTSGSLIRSFLVLYAKGDVHQWKEVLNQYSTWASK